MKILTIVPWFPSLNADTMESRQGIFEHRQLMELLKRGNEFRVISIRWRGQSDYEVIADTIEVYRISSIFIFPDLSANSLAQEKTKSSYDNNYRCFSGDIMVLWQ